MRKMKKIIGVDVDDVLVDLCDVVINFHHTRYGSTLKRQDVLSFKVEEALGISHDEMEKRFLLLVSNFQFLLLFLY